MNWRDDDDLIVTGIEHIDHSVTWVVHHPSRLWKILNWFRRKIMSDPVEQRETHDEEDTPDYGEID